MSRRHILWVSHIVPFPPAAGVLLRAYNLLKAVGAEHDVTLVAFIQEIWLQTCFADRDEGLARCRQALAECCSEIHFLPIEKLQRWGGRPRVALSSLVAEGGYMGQWLQGEKAHETMRELAAKRRFDLAHFDTIALAPYRTHFPGAPATLGYHNIESHMLLRRASNEKNLLKKAYFQREGARLERYERAMGNQFDLHITCSDLDSERLAKLLPAGRIETIPNGVDCDFFKPQGVQPRPTSLIFIGTMNWYPNVTAMLFFLREVWPQLKAKLPAVTLDIVGANPPQELVAAAKASSGVSLHGFVPEIRPMLEAAALFVCPIHDGGGTKLKVLDAFAMQKCMIAHPVACEGIEVSPGENVVFAVEPEEWVRQIAALLEDREWAARIGVAARTLVETRYSFAAIGRRLAQLFDEVAQPALGGSERAAR